ncbi:5348_t:CDS:2, partial [Scutellospora calospora]
QLLPEVNKWLSEFLTPPVLSLQRVEIAKALWYNANLVPKENLNINLLQEKSENGFYEDFDDSLAANINEVITNLSTLSIKEGLFCHYFAKVITISQIAAFHILMIPRRWYSDKYYSKSDESLRSQSSITYKNRSAILTSNFTSNSTFMYSSSGISFNTSKTLNTHCVYIITNGLCKKAIAVRLDASSTAMETLNKFLENFIQQFSINSNQHLVTNTTSREMQDDKSSDSDDDQENVISFDVSMVQDPVVKKRKGAPKIKRIKSSLETKKAQSNIRKEKATRLCSR